MMAVIEKSQIDIVLPHINDKMNEIRHPYDMPIGDDLIKFIQIQGTKNVSEAIRILIDHDQEKKINEGVLDPYRFNILIDSDRKIDEFNRKVFLPNHMCKIPKKHHFEENFEPSEIDDVQCILKQITMVNVFIKNVQINKYKNLNLGDESSNDHLIYQDLKRKADIPWNEKSPLHTCIYNYNEKKPICTCDGGLSHWELLDEILSSMISKKINDQEIKRNFKTTLSKKIDPHLFIPWKNEDGELSFDYDIYNHQRNCIDTSVYMGNFNIRDFIGIVGLNVEFVWMGIDDVMFCPSGTSNQGPHICYNIGCDTIITGGYTRCSLTGIILSDKMGIWTINPNNYSTNGVDEMLRNDISECRKVFLKRPRHVNVGVSNNDIKSETHEGCIFKTIVDGKKTVEELERFQNEMKSTSKNRTIKDKEKRNQIKSAILNNGNENEMKIAISGHFSDYNEYKMEAFLTIQKLFYFGKTPLKAMLITMEKLTNGVIGYDGQASSSNTPSLIDTISHEKQKKITFKINGEEDIKRKRLTPTNYLRIEDKSSSESSMNDHQQTKKQRMISTISYDETKQNDGMVFDEIVEFINPDDVTKNISDKINILSEAVIRFWALIKTRTQMGREKSNCFNFYSFIYAFLFLQRDGYELNTGIAGHGDKIVFFEKDIFLKHALPKEMDDLLSFGIQNNTKRDIKIVYNNIKQALKETIIDEHISYHDLDPYKNNKLDFSITSLEFPPSLFISLQQKKNIK